MCMILMLTTYLINKDIKTNDENVEVSAIYDNSASSIVMDKITKRVLYKNNINERMLPASTTKILTCITALELYNLDDVVIVTKEMLMVDGSSIYLEVGDVITILDLLYGLMLCSGNDAALALAYHYSGNDKDFIYEMNKLAKKIGMKNSTFENPHGLDEYTKNYTTVYDMALLMSYALNNEVFCKITKTIKYNPVIVSNKRLYFYNKHRLIRNMDNVTGGKTGYTKKAHRTLVTSFKKEEFEIVVVTFNCSDDWNVHRSLAEYVFNQYQVTKIVSKFELELKNLSNDFYIKSNKLFIPISKDEQIHYEIDKTQEELIVIYYLEKSKIGYITFGSLDE